MKKITMLGISAMLAVTLVACDNGDKKAEAAKTDTVPAVSSPASSETTKVEPLVPAQPLQEIIDISPEPTQHGATDYKRLSQWENLQEQKLGELGIKIQQQVQEAMTTKTVPQGLEENVKAYKANLEEITKGLMNLSIVDLEIKALAEKKRELYRLSGEGLALSVNAMTSTDQSPEAIRKFEQQIGDISNKVNQLNTIIGKAETALDKKYPQQ